MEDIPDVCKNIKNSEESLNEIISESENITSPKDISVKNPFDGLFNLTSGMLCKMTMLANTSGRNYNPTPPSKEDIEKVFLSLNLQNAETSKIIDEKSLMINDFNK